MLDVYDVRLFLSQTSLRWKAKGVCTTFCTDANGDGNPVMGIGDGPTYNCVFTDGEDPGGLDLVEGFRLFGLAATCVLVIVD